MREKLSRFGLPVLAVIPKMSVDLLKAPYRPPELQDGEAT